MTHRERILAALRGEPHDRVPLTAYPDMLPRGGVERWLRNENLGFIWPTAVTDFCTPNVSEEVVYYKEHGQLMSHKVVSTPVGEIRETWRHGTALGGAVRSEFLLKEPDDYTVFEYILQHGCHEGRDEQVRALQRAVGEDGLVVGHLGYSPMQDMIVNLMGIDGFAVQWHEYRGDLLVLYDLMVQRHRQAFEIAADSPVELVIYGDNVTSPVIGLARFEEYAVPMYDLFADAMHSQGKLAASHQDGMVCLLADAIARTKLDVIEAFTPPPDGDLPLDEAFANWPGKTISINFPSSIHLEPPDRVEEETIRLLEEAAPLSRFLIGITEDVPPDRWQHTLPVISRVLAERGVVDS